MYDVCSHAHFFMESESLNDFSVVLFLNPAHHRLITFKYSLFLYSFLYVILISHISGYHGFNCFSVIYWAKCGISQKNHCYIACTIFCCLTVGDLSAVLLEVHHGPDC